MNYQLLIESYTKGIELTEQEMMLLNLELDSQLLNLPLSKDLGCLYSAPEYICERLQIRKGSYWITCLAQIIDIHKLSHNFKSKGAEVYDALLSEGFEIG